MVKEHIKDLGKNSAGYASTRELVLYNDDFNTFDFVIKCLIDVCKHEPEQAEQCALITHYKGSCGVKCGDYETLEPLYRELLNRGLTLVID